MPWVLGAEGCEHRHRCGAMRPREDGRQHEDDWLKDLSAAVARAKRARVESRKAEDTAKKAAQAAEDARIETRQAVYNFRVVEI